MTTTTPQPLLNATARRFNETHSLLRRFVILPDSAAYDIATLWCMHTHVRDADDNYAFDYTPRIAFLSDGPASGKTVALDKVSLLANRGTRITSPTAPAVSMMISTEKLIPCIDEIDELFGKTSASKSDLRAVLNTGYERGGIIARAGKLQEVFGPVAFAGMGANFQNNPALRALRSRTIAVWMRPKEAHESVETFRKRYHDSEFDSMNRNLSMWGKHHMLKLVMAEPEMPTGIENRDIDLWTPLLSIAELAGEEIAERGRNAILQYVASVAPANAELNETDRMIVAMANIFHNHNATQLSTATIVESLFELDNGVWRNQFDGNPLSAAKHMANLLSTIEVNPIRMREEDGRQVRGYNVTPILPYVPEGYGPDDTEQTVDDVSDLPLV